MMEIILFSIFLLLPIIFVYLLHKISQRSAKTLIPPGPPGLPLIGNLHQFATAGIPHIFLWKLAKKYGPIMQMKLGSVPVLIISSAKFAKNVLKTHDLVFCSRPKLRGQQKLSYNGVDIAFSPYNEYWREMRKITAVHLFSVKKIQSFYPIRKDEIIHRMIKRVASSCGHVVNLNDLAMALTSTLIYRSAFGKRYDEEGREMRRFNELMHDAEAVAATSFVSDYFPWFGWVDKLNGSLNRLDATCKKLDLFYQELIDEHVDPDRAKNVDLDEDILDVLIKLKEEKLGSIELNWDHIKALLMNIIIAATDTTAAAIVWTMTGLMKTPNVMKKLQIEMRSTIGSKGYVDEEDLPKLPYLKAVISESLRLYPPAPLLVPRETIETCTLEGYKIEPKTLVYVNAWAISRDPEYWENPDEFLPERFLGKNVDIKGQDNYNMIPFGSGRRICPGMHMGLATVELTVANLVYPFDWELPENICAQDIDTDPLLGISMQKKNPLYIVPMKYTII
ncbi:6,7,8-trihydroxycoumarin synthase-like [Andrographis paniculata]|uniref:6,7,8-trihydroxycoumarin synthase-like n=1 Tax=Andrographis paniculata TaxID=175694 RepID=UPI0021E8E78F|nr:6,7,8-trihydroxycoumarin synthase-like [Andrographis paniculata]